MIDIENPVFKAGDLVKHEKLGDGEVLKMLDLVVNGHKFAKVDFNGRILDCKTTFLSLVVSDGKQI